MQIYVQLKNRTHPVVIRTGEVDTGNLQRDMARVLNGFLIIKEHDQVVGMFNATEVAGWWLVEEDSKEKGEEHG